MGAEGWARWDGRGGMGGMGWARWDGPSGMAGWDVLRGIGYVGWVGRHLSRKCLPLTDWQRNVSYTGTLRAVPSVA